jgi:hypothetical protein
VCSSNTTVGVIVGAAADGCKTVTVAEMESRSANGSLEFDAVGQGTTTVCASSPGFIMIPPSCRDVRVSGIATNINGHDDLGSYLQDEYVLALSSAVASNSTFTITSTTPSLCKVAVNLLDVGVNSITVTVPQGRSRASFFVHGMDGVSGTCVLTATPPAGSGITDGLREIAIVTPGLKIVNLDGQRSTQATNDKFNVKTGVPQANLRDLAFAQAPRAGGGGVDLKVCSSNPTVGVIVGAGSDGCKTVNLPATESQTPDGLLEFDALAAGTTTICVYVDGFITTDAGCRDVVVASIVPNVNGPDQLGNGLQDSYTLVLSSAVANDATFTIASVTPAQCKLAPNATTAGTNAISVTVPAGRARATFYVQGFDEGTCDLTVTAPAGAGISDGQAEIQIVTPALRILNLDGSRSTQSQNDPFNVEIGIPQPNLKSLATAQAIRAGAAALSIPVCSSNTTVGIVVGAGSDGCKTVTLGAGASRTAEGVLEFDPLNGGNTTVCAGAVGYIATDAACRDIVVSAVAININGPDTLGANLEDQYTLALSAGVSVDTTFTVTSLTPAVCKLSVSRTIAGIPTIALTIPKGRSRADFYVHGIDVGACSLSVTTAASGYGSGLSDIDVVPPGLRILNLAGNLKTGGTDDPFDVEIGVPQGNLKTLARVQELRAGSANLTITACSSNIAAATVVGSGSDPYCKTGYITANATRPTPSAFAVHAVAVGASTISVSAPDFISTDAASKDVTVASGTISISGPDAVGAGLQDTFTVNLNPKAAATGGVPITLTSLTPTLCKVAQDIETAGGTTYALTIAKGKSMAKIAIQALENVTGTCLIRSTTTDPAYVGEDTSVEIVQPGVRIRSLDPTTTVASATDEFFIDVGVPKDNLANLRLVQTVRAGAPALLVKACSSSPTVAAVVGAAGDGCKSVYIAAGDSATAKGDLVLQPLNAGSTIIDARSTGYITTDAGSVDVYVASAALSFSETNIDRVGSGLMDTFNLKSSATVGVDTPVTVTSLSPDVCRVAVDESSASAISTTVTIKAGRQKQTFAIHGLENATGACQLRATYSGFADGYASYDIVSPALRIDGLGTSKSTTSGDDSFTVQVGVAKADLKNLQVKQKVRIGAPTLTITVCSSDPFVGKILVSSVLDTCRTVYLAGGQSDTASGVVKFRVVAGGTTTVDAASPGYIVTDAGTVDVTVSGAGLALSIESTSANAIGAGLQRGSFYVERTGSTSSAITTTVTVLTPTLCKVASSGTAGGVTALAVTIASGSTTSGYFWVQGLENQLGNCQLQVSASGYPTGSGDVDIVRPAIRVTNIAGSIGSTAANDPFNVEIGIADDSQTTLAEVQQVRAGSLGFSMTVANSNAASGVLVGSNGLNQQVTGQSITVKINAGQSANTTGALQRLEFDPDDSLAASTGTTISASHPDAISTAGATQTVVVVLGSGC